MMAQQGEAVHVMSGMMQSPSQAEGSDGGNNNTGKEKGERGDGPRKEFNFWTDQEVWFLLDAYEEKWNQLDRGNVKSKHWEEIASRLANHSSGLWTAKTPTQCKNKIEDMKKKYRAEKAMKNGAGSYSKWVFFQRMESMLRNGFKAVGMPGGMDNGEHAQPVMDLDSYGNCSQLENLQFRQCAATAAARLTEKDMHDGEEEDTSFTTPHQVRKENGGNLTNLLESSRARDDIPGLDGRPSLKRRKHSPGGSINDVMSVIKSFGESLLRIEEAQIQMQREIARLNAEAELRRMEMEVKRTEMMLNTQLQIAKLFSAKPRKKKVVKKAAENGGVQGNEEQPSVSRS